MNKFTMRRAKFSNHADGSDAALTFHDIVGQDAGPTIGISGAIHGNEPTSTEIILDLYRALHSIPIRGRIVLLPVANPRAYAQNRRFTTIDELNLNREFPGDPHGSYTQQLAAAVTKEFLEQIDVHIDLHSGTDRPTVDYVYIWNDEALSRSFGSSVLYRPQPMREGTTFNGTTTTVTIKRRNIPAVVVELGGGIVDQRPYVERGLNGVLNMLRHLQVIEGEPTPPPKQIVVGAIKTIRPTRAGLLETLAPPLGEMIKKGELLGRVVSPYTFEVLEEIPTPFDAGVMILSHLSRNLVESGDFAYMVGDMHGAES